MAAKKFLRLVSGVFTEIAGIVTSAGAGNDGDFPVLDATGKLDTSLMPTGIGADTASITASENLAAGDLVNVHVSTGYKVRKADATTAGKEAHGFVLSAVTSGAAGTVYFEGSNTGCSTATVAGVWYLSTTAGIPTQTPPSGSGNVVQRVGISPVSGTLNFDMGVPVTLA